MRNHITTTVTGLVYHGEIAAVGLTDYAASLSLTRLTAAGFNARVDNLTDARDAHDDAKIDYRDAKAAADAMVKSAIEYATLARDVLKPHLGKTKSDAFTGAGYDGTLAIPRTIPKLIALMQRLNSHFVAHPEHENAVLNVNAARANTFANDLTTAAATLIDKKTKVGLKKVERDAKAALLRDDLQTLLGELHVALDPTDYLWEKFGFKRPGILQMPEVPLNVVAMLIGPNSVAVKWDRPERARTYRVWKKVVGIDTDFVLVDTRTDLDATIEGLPANATIEIAVSASNNGGESAKSEPVVVTTP